MRRTLFSATALSGVFLSAALIYAAMTVTPAHAETSKDGYSGLIAPSHTDEAPAAPEEPQGYEGLIPGKVDKPDTTLMTTPKPNKSAGKTDPSRSPFAPAVDKKAETEKKMSKIDDTPKMSYPRGITPRGGELSPEDIKTLAALSAKGFDINHIPPAMERSLKLPEGISKMLNTVTRPRIDGMLPAEFNAKRQIDAQMDAVEKLQGDARKQAAQQAFDQLSATADGYRTLNSVPDSVYQRLGVSDTYTKEEHEGYSKSLSRLKEALEALQQLKK